MSEPVLITGFDCGLIAHSIGSDIVSMVFDENTDINGSLARFTNPDMRPDQQDKNLVWKNGNSRFPHINKFSGVVALYENLSVLELGLSDQVLKILGSLYGTSDLVYAHGPPAPLVKPNGAIKSPAQVYSFQNVNQDGKVRYTGIICLSKNDGTHKSGQLQVLSNFDAYYDVLNAFYRFETHSKTNEIIHLDHQWFNVADANAFMEEYFALYNWNVHKIPCTLNRVVRWEVSQIYNRTKLEVSKQFEPMTWKTLDSEQGQMYIFNSKQAVRTASNKTAEARVYLQIAVEPKPKNWMKMMTYHTLRSSYNTGKFGDWSKPGVRSYLRENSTEYNWRRVKQAKQSAIEKFTPTQLTVLGL